MRNSCTFKLAGPVTFRRASSRILGEKNKKNVGWGTNVQNIEGELRSVYISDGFSPSLEERCLYYLENNFDISVFTEEELLTLKVMLQSDQSGAEGVLVAWDTRNADYRSIFKNGISPHVYVAMKLFPEDWKRAIREKNIPISPDCVDVLYYMSIDNLKKNPDWGQLSALIKDSDNWPLTERYYYFAKQTVHSFSYDIRWHTFIMNILEKSGGKVVISREDGERFLLTIRSLFPEVPERNRRIDEVVRKSGMIFNIHGEPYTIWPGGNPPEHLLSDMKKFYAWGPQSGVAGITSKAVCSFQEFVENEKKQWDLLTETHDSYLTQGLLHDTKERYEVMNKSFLEQELVSGFDGSHFRMKSETKIAFNWGGKDKEKNKLGMRVYKPL